MKRFTENLIFLGIGAAIGIVSSAVTVCATLKVLKKLADDEYTTLAVLEDTKEPTPTETPAPESTATVEEPPRGVIFNNIQYWEAMHNLPVDASTDQYIDIADQYAEQIGNDYTSETEIVENEKDLGSEKFIRFMYVCQDNPEEGTYEFREIVDVNGDILDTDECDIFFGKIPVCKMFDEDDSLNKLYIHNYTIGKDIVVLRVIDE